MRPVPQSICPVLCTYLQVMGHVLQEDIACLVLGEQRDPLPLTLLHNQ